MGGVAFAGKAMKGRRKPLNKKAKVAVISKELIRDNPLEHYPKKMAVRAKRYTCMCCCECFKKKKKKFNS